MDRRDIGNLVKIADFDIPNFDAFHVTVVGNTAYVTGGAAGIAVVDLTNPKVPALVGIVKTPGNPRRTDALGAILAAADGSAGATFLDITAASLPAILGNQQTGGDAWDVAFNA